MKDLAKQLAQRFVSLPISQRERFLAQLAEKNWDFQRLPLVAFPNEEIASLTLAQRRLWFLWKLAPESHAYNLAGALRWRGRLNFAALNQALLQVLRRHSALRTRFVTTSDGGAEQHVESLDDISLQIDEAFLQFEKASLQFEEASDFSNAKIIAERYAQQPFDLERDLPFRVGLIRIADDDHLLWMVAHHIVADGWSMQVVLDDLLASYRSSSEQSKQFENVSTASDTTTDEFLTYRDFACWQRYALTPSELERQLNYWRTLHAGAIEPLHLPLDRPRAATQSLRGARHTFHIDATITARIREHAATNNATLFMWLLAAYQILLYRLTGQTDFRIGIVNAGRQRPETEKLVGFFVGTQVLRLPTEGVQTFDQLLQAARTAAEGAQAHPDLPFERLVEALAPERDLSRNPIFQAKFTQQIALPTRIELIDATIELLTLPDAATHFDLGLDITDRGETIEALFTYDTDLFDAQTVAGWGEQLRDIANFFSAKPTARVSDWQSINSEFSSGKFSNAEFSGGDSLAPPWPSVLDAWQAQVSENINAQALHCEEKINGCEEKINGLDEKINVQEREWTRGEIDAAANALANQLIARGVVAGSRVALCTMRSSALVIGILATWKAGAAYVPLDAKQPAERLRWVIKDAQALLAIVDDEGESALRDSGIERLNIDAGKNYSNVTTNKKIAIAISAQWPAYLIYTSGSTGRPKGVVITHAALAHYIAGVLQRLALKTDASFAMVSTVAADLGHTTLFGALAAGRLLHLISAERAFDPDRFAAYMREHTVGVLKIVPSHLQGLLQAAQPADVLPRHALIVGGETTHAALLKQLRELAPACRIINHYGPTETTVGVLTEEAIAEIETLPLGRPLPNVDVWILDRDLNPVQVGVVGELYLGGPQLALGYADKPALTAERFVPHPFRSGARLYRSGDAAKYLRDGRIVYLGRRDDQIKIRGYRVELKEIAAQLLAQPTIRAAEVAVCEIDGHAQLLAWVVPETVDVGAVKTALAATLPDYMVPMQILALAAMPLTANGKIDRAALPLPQRARQNSHTALDKMRAPRSEAERVLLSVWQSVLNNDTIGIDDNFFEIGGDSILSLQVIARARKLGVRLTPKQLFEKQTIAELAAVAQSKKEISPAKEIEPIDAAFALTPIQHHFFALPISNRNHWNQSVLLTPREKIDATRLLNTLSLIVDAHPALRTRFDFHTNTQQVSTATVHFVASKLSDDELRTACEVMQRSLNINNGQLLAALLAELPDGTQRLLLCVHHLAIDGVSWRILLDDLSATYRDSVQALPAPSLSFSAWSQRLQQFAYEPALLAERNYWRNIVAYAAAVTPAVAIAKAKQQRFSLSAQITRCLQTDARAVYGTRGDELLLAAFLQAWTQTLRIELPCVWLEHHGRDLEGIDASRCIGWFTSLYPVKFKTESNANSTAINTISEVKKMVRAVPNFGIGYGVLRYLAGDADLAAAPQIVFNHLGRFDNNLHADSLFDFSNESVGAERDPSGPLTAPLILVSREIDGELNFDWTYSEQHYSTETIEQLARNYTAALNAIVDAADTRRFAAIYPTAPIQQGLLFHAQLAPESTAYINQLGVTFTDLDSERFIAAWQRALARHDILRTAFEGAGAESQQYVYREVALPLRVLDWRGNIDFLTDLENLEASEKNQCFVFEAAPLMRLVLVRINERETRFIWTRHHLLLDGWSTARLLAEIIDDYSGRTIATPSLRYRDHIDWLARRDTAAENNFWREQLRELDEPTLLASSVPKTIHSETGHAEARHALHVLTLSETDSKQLAEFARAQHITLNTLLQSAWAILLGRYSGKRNICFGVTVAGRPAELDEIDSVLGLFINTLPLICALDPAQSVTKFLRALQTRNAALREFEQMPLQAIQQLFNGDQQRGASYQQSGSHELFDTLLVFENFPLTTSAHATLQARDVSVDEATHYALTLVVEPGRELALRFSHDRARIDTQAVQQLSAHFQTLLLALIKNADAPLASIALPPSSAQWNAAARDWGATIPVHEAFRRQALHSPHAKALAMGDRLLSYVELDTAANNWAQRLLQAGVTHESIVAIAAERSFELVIGLLAILKTGAAYLPIDPDYPADRIAYMLDDAKPTLLLTQRHLFTRFADSPVNMPVLNLDDTPAVATCVISESIHAEQLAYLIYTSGSTGKPKGAGNTHAGLHNRLAWMQAVYPIGKGNHVLQKTPISFDVSVWEFFWPLITGATLVLAAPQAHRDPQLLIDTICQQRIDTLHFVPSMLQALLLHADVERCTSLRQIICSGEALPSAVQNELLGRLPQARLYNLYGPTEAAIDVTHWTCAVGDAAVPIGAPIANTQIYILDADLNALPAGVAGELYIGGINLARGYFGRAALTAERFIPNPFAHGERLYRSGDLARWRDDGNVDYLGRLDHQIKLRGQRIELGEIETALRSCIGVRDGVVIAMNSAMGQQLVAYVVAPENFSAADARSALQKLLPDYMVPSAITRLDALPLSPNGKLDRKALPAPEIDNEPWQAPVSALEKQLAAHWCALLGHERVGRRDQFFALGGHSLLAAQLVARLRGELGVAVPLKQLFDTPVLADFSAAIETLQASTLNREKADAIADLLSELEV